MKIRLCGIFYVGCLTLSGFMIPAGGQGVFTRSDVLVGDPSVSYGSTEFTSDWKYLVWGEYAANGTNDMVIWHCGVDPDTGDLIPPDGKGFRAFESSGWSRASPGRDSLGVFYVGLNRQGRLVLVRPSGATEGTVSILPTPADNTRRGIYATDLPEAPGSAGYVFWIKNSDVAGGPGDPRNTWVELRYIALTDPEVEIVLQHQQRPPVANAFAPLDIAFPRCLRGSAGITSGHRDANGDVQVVEFDLAHPHPTPRLVTSDAVTKSDAFPWSLNGWDLLMSGTDSSQGATQIYTRPAGSQFFTPVELITPRIDTLEPPVFAQSNEGIPFAGLPFTTFQVNSRADDFFGTTFQETGEIWLSTISQTPRQQWRLSEDTDKAKFEPEPYVGRTKVWVFYSSCPRGSMLLDTVIHLRRCATPLRVPDPAAPLRIVTASQLEAGIAGTGYSMSLTAEGGTAGYSWSVIAGELPDGLEIDDTGTLSGTPAVPGMIEFTLQVADSAYPHPEFTSGSFLLTIVEPRALLSNLADFLVENILAWPLPASLDVDLNADGRVDMADLVLLRQLID